MWNSESPLQLLLSMPSQLSLENLINLQEVIDVDKMLNSQAYKRDLCGEYAPFCDFCDKKLQYPCAHAYVKMKQADGLDVEIPDEVVAQTSVSKQEEEPVEEPQPEEEVVEEKPKRYIRIATARKIR